MQINVLEYWPMPEVNAPIHIIYSLPGSKVRSVFSIDPNNAEVFYEDDYLNGEWLWRWHFRRDPLRGLLEFADTEKSNGYHKMFGPKRTLRYAGGEEIFWGHLHNVGSEFTAPCRVNPLTSTFPTLPSRGWNRVRFEKHHPVFTTCDGLHTYVNVVEMVNDQQWQDNLGRWNTPSKGMRMWMAQGLGHVQIQFRQGDIDLAVPVSATRETGSLTA